jgi:hypothetical protein
MYPKLLTAGLAAIAGLLLLAACDGSDPTPTPKPAATPTPDPTATPTPEPPATPPTPPAPTSTPTPSGPVEGSVTLPPSKDTTLYKEGELGNGAGEFIFAGKTRKGVARRGLIAFDIAAVVP